MITTEPTSSPRRRMWWAFGMCLIAALGVGVWGGLRVERDGTESAAAAGRSVASPSTGGQVGSGSVISALADPVVLPDGRPSDFSAEDWAALKEALAKTSHPEAELKRVVSYLRFQKGFAQWQSLRESSDVVRRQQLASALSQQLPERLRQGEVSMGEAMMLAAALWSDLEPNEDKRKVRLEEVRAVLAQSVPQPDAAQQAREAAQQTEYKRREAAIVLEYQSRPESQRDQVWLEAQLDAARRAVYGGN